MPKSESIRLLCYSCQYRFEVILEPDIAGGVVYTGNCPNCGAGFSNVEINGKRCYRKTTKMEVIGHEH